MPHQITRNKPPRSWPAQGIDSRFVPVTITIEPITNGTARVVQHHPVHRQGLVEADDPRSTSRRPSS